MDILGDRRFARRCLGRVDEEHGELLALVTIWLKLHMKLAMLCRWSFRWHVHSANQIAGTCLPRYLSNVFVLNVTIISFSQLSATPRNMCSTRKSISKTSITSYLGIMYLRAT